MLYRKDSAPDLKEKYCAFLLGKTHYPDGPDIRKANNKSCADLILIYYEEDFVYKHLSAVHFRVCSEMVFDLFWTFAEGTPIGRAL